MAKVGERFGQVVHVAYAVADIDEAMSEWLAGLGIGPWTCIRNIELESVYCGEPLTLRLHEALAYAGTLQIQLVQCLNRADEATPYQDRQRNGAWGLHHVAYFSDDIDHDMATARAQGFGSTCEMQSKDGHRYCYLRGEKTSTEVWIELLERFPLISDLYRQGIAETATWDRTDPIRNVDYNDL
jgi:Glyoxalase/Bleomycin resistance protein/Dioxygenase superfamily